MDNIVHKNTIKFLDVELEMTTEDRNDAVLLLYLSQIEMMERMFGQGLKYMQILRNNYGIRPSDQNLMTRIQNVLISNNKRGIDEQNTGK